MNEPSLLNATLGDLRRSWKALVPTAVAYKIIAFVVLTPLVGTLYQVLLATSGRAVLADQDIVFFFLGPLGWICFILVGSLWLGIVALEQAALIGILSAAAEQKRIGVVTALRFAVANARTVLFVTARLLTLTLLTVAPFLLAVGLVYRLLLWEYDINYYLTVKPSEFLVASALGGAIAAALVAALLRLTTSWFFALPLVLFEGVGSARALQVSRERATGHRRTLLLWIAGWVLVSTVISALATGLVILLGRLFVPFATNSLGLLAVAVGTTLVLWAGANLITNLLSTTVFAAMLFNLYRQLGNPGSIDPPRLNIVEETKDETGFLWTRPRLLGIAATGTILAIAIGVFAAQSVRLEDNTEITAHRGSSKAAPENTMAAVRKAIEEGADWVEIDVQETADGEVVVFHDSDFMKLAGVNLKIWDATMADLENIDIGSWFDPEFKDARVPTLGEVLDECKGKAGVNIELKYYGHDKQLEQRVVDVVEAHGMASEIVVMSLKMDAVRKIKSLRPNWKAGLLMSVSAGNLRSINVDFLAVNAGFANRSLIHSAHKAGREVHVWTVNDAPTMSVMMTRGVDSLITDKPALARSVLAQRTEMSPAERLLLELAGILGVVPEIGEP